MRARLFLLFSSSIFFSIAGLSLSTIAIAQVHIDRPLLLDNPSYDLEVVDTLNLQEKMSLINMTYDYCSQPSNLAGDDADKCRMQNL